MFDLAEGSASGGVVVAVAVFLDRGCFWPDFQTDQEATLDTYAIPANPDTPSYYAVRVATSFSYDAEWEYFV